MNKFRDTLDEMKRRADKDAHLKELLRDAEKSEHPSDGKTKLRLPYSSDPVFPIEERWGDV